jgi:REP element-mobilizing transposase RayT
MAGGRGMPRPYEKTATGWVDMTHNYDHERHHRRSIRLDGYDYAQDGVYFVTVCAYGRECRFGSIADEIMQINAEGEIIVACWQAIPEHFQNAELDEFIIMPNHIHGIVSIACENRNTERSTTTPKGTTRSSLGAVVGAFKSAATKRINQLDETASNPVWQRGYYERIIRDERELNDTRQYIVDNPLKWALDDENPTRLPHISL